MYNCITTFPQKYDAYVNKSFYVHLKFSKFHNSHTIVAMVSFYDQNMHLIYGFDQFVIWLYSQVAHIIYTPFFSSLFEKHDLDVVIDIDSLYLCLYRPISNTSII